MRGDGRALTADAEQEARIYRIPLGPGHVAVEEKPAPNLHIVRRPIRTMPGGWRELVDWRSAIVMMFALTGSQASVLIRMAQKISGILGIDEAIAGLMTPVDVVHGFNISWEYA